MLFKCFTIALLLAVLCSVWGCPSEESINPCICKDLGDGPMLLCSNLMNAEELIPPVKATDNMNMFAISIIDSSLLYVPATVFKNTNYAKIRFANSQIMALSDSDLAFEGLEDTLEELRATDAHYITTWDWSQLRNLRRIELIDVNWISMYSLDQELPALKSLATLGISHAEISFVHETAFQELKNLKTLVLKNNEITRLSRSMFPKPATLLYTLDLSGNQLDELPYDMFSGMPSLKEVVLSNNQLVTLDEDTFSWPFENLQELKLDGNKFRCDCRLRWLVNNRRPHYFQGTCALPGNLKGVSILELTNKVIWCF